jgi:hypothetical protein
MMREKSRAGTECRGLNLLVSVHRGNMPADGATASLRCASHCSLSSLSVHSLNVVSVSPPLFAQILSPLSVSRRQCTLTQRLSTDTALLNSAPLPLSVPCLTVVCMCPPAVCTQLYTMSSSRSQLQRTDTPLSYSALTSVLSVGLCISFC